VDTSGDGTANVVLYLVVLALWVNVVIRLLPTSTLPRRFPLVALVFAVLIGVPSLLQFGMPQLTKALERIPSLTVHEGQWWRVVTALAAQDGGLPGAIFNLIVVIAVVTLGEWIWGRWRTIVLFLGPSIILNLLAIAWNQSGGGSSFASDGLLMSMCGLALATRRNLIAKLCAVVAVGIGVVLVVLNDAHGVAILLGAVLGVIFGLLERGKAREPLRAPSPGY
jgi:membrane associated rhomboid family serine protease